MTDLREGPSALEGERPATAAGPPVDAPANARWARWAPRLRWVLGPAWLAGIGAYLIFEGVPVDRATIIAFTMLGLLVWSMGRRSPWSVIIDWLPFALVLVVYDYTRGAADALGSPTQWTWQITTDRWLGFGHIPTVWLQERLKQAQPPLWEVGVSLFYVSFYFVPYLVAGWLWLRSRSDFRAYALRFTTLSFAGLATFVAMPSAPPWAAAQCTAAEVAGHPANPPCIDRLDAAGVPHGGLLGLLSPHLPGAAPFVERISSRGFASLHLLNAQELLKEGQASVNLVAAIPSLHSATTLLVSMFLWPRVRRRWRPLLAIYPFAMAFTLIYSAEHYLTDILLGWALAVAVEYGFRALRRRRDRRAVSADNDGNNNHGGETDSGETDSDDPAPATFAPTAG